MKPESPKIVYSSWTVNDEWESNTKQNTNERDIQSTAKTEQNTNERDIHSTAKTEQNTNERDIHSTAKYQEKKNADAENA